MEEWSKILTAHGQLTAFFEWYRNTVNESEIVHTCLREFIEGGFLTAVFEGGKLGHFIGFQSIDPEYSALRGLAPQINVHTNADKVNQLTALKSSPDVHLGSFLLLIVQQFLSFNLNLDTARFVLDSFVHDFQSVC